MARERDDDYEDDDQEDDYEEKPRRKRRGGGGGGPPPNYLVQSILTTICCCTPIGIVAIVFAAQVNSKYASGDTEGALSSSAKAKQFSTISAVLGIIVIIAVTILQLTVLKQQN